VQEETAFISCVAKTADDAQKVQPERWFVVVELLANALEEFGTLGHGGSYRRRQSE
jgi:hypothetical protein